MTKIHARNFASMLSIVMTLHAHAYAGNCTTDMDVNGQVATHCEAAKGAKNTKNAAMMGMLVYGASAAVCAAVCASAIQVNGPVCAGSSLAAHVADAGMTMALAKDMQGSMMGLVGALPSAMNVFEKGAEGGIQLAQKQEGKESCMIAAMDAMMAMMKGMTMKNAGDQEKENNAAAQRLASQEYSTGAVGGATSASSAGAKVGAANSNIQKDLDKSHAEEKDCTKDSSASGEAKVACAIAKDPSIKISGKALDDAFKSKGVDLGQFMNSMPEGASGAQVTKAAMTALGLDASKVDAQLAAMEADLGASSEALAYAGGGGGGKKAGGGEGFDMGKAMKDMMAGMFGKKDEAKKASTDLLEFKLGKLTPAQIEQDRSISIFDRVTFRYRKSAPRVDQLPWAGSYNRAVAGSASQ